MTEREAFERWYVARWPATSHRPNNDRQGDTYYSAPKADAWSAWQAAAARYEAVVEAGRECVDRAKSFCACDKESPGYVCDTCAVTWPMATALAALDGAHD